MNTLEMQGNSKEKFDGDKLDRIFAAQKELMVNYRGIAESHYSKIFGGTLNIPEGVWNGGESNLHTKAGNYFIRDMLNACSQEIGEAIQTLKNWKAWKQTEIPSDADHFREELIDSLHFFVEACILAGITPEMMYDLYFKKNEVNHFRQESKY